MHSPAPTPPATSFRFWQTATVAGLFIGYSGYYLCRSNLAVATPLLIDEFGSRGIDKEVMGQIASLGVLFYSVGKVVSGVIGDLVGGKKIFLLGMAGSVLATVLFGLGAGLAVFFPAWAFNRAMQSMGWGGLVKVTAGWFSYRSYGKIMALLSLSFLFGDVVARLLLGSLMNRGLHWRELFYVAAAVLAVIAVLDVFLVKESPERLGLPAPPVNPDNLFTEGGADERAGSLRELLLPYFRSLSFRLVLVMSFGLTAIREAFNFWLPTYLHEVARLPESAASQFSSLYPVFGMVSILAAGYLSDTVARGRRGVVIGLALLPLTAILGLVSVGFTGQWLPLVFISLAGLLLQGPYSFLAGAMSLDVGGRKGAATAVGLVDAVGYVGSMLSLWLTGLLAQRVGWNSAFLLLAGLAALTAGAAGMYYWTQERGR
jgi:OPA family glycerol-3-phosphate transporter-like MFS transporter